MLKGDDLYVERLQTSGSCPTNKEKKRKRSSARRERRVDLWSVASNPLVNEVASCKNSFRGSLRRLKP